MKARIYRSAYLMALMASFVLASGAGRKFGG
jgi:hypothetical protein